jgi:uncharacterized protein (DUF58 family)
MQEKPQEAEAWTWSALDDEDAEPEQALLQALKRLEIVARRKVDHLFAGDYQSSFRGRGMSFDDFRLYQPGDETRWIDWNVSARMGDIYVKQFVEERERSVMILWDASPSMQWGSVWRSKRMLGAELAMLLALSAVKNNDRVGLIVFRDRVERYVAPRKGRKHVMRLIREILHQPPLPSQPTQSDLYAALDYLQHVELRHTIVFLLSDFLYPIEERRLQVAGQRYELNAFCIRDPREMAFSSDEAENAEHLTLGDSALSKEAEAAPSSNEGAVEEGEEGGEKKQAGMGELGGVGLFSWFVVLLWWLPAVVWGGAWWLSAGVGTLWALWGAWSMLPQHHGMVWLRDLERQGFYALPLDQKTLRLQHQRDAQQQRQAWQEALQRAQVDALFLQTDQDVLPALHRFFRQHRAQGKR